MTETAKQRRIVLKPGESYVLQPEDNDNPPLVECAPMKYDEPAAEREAFEAWLGRRYPLADATDADDAFEAAMLECWQAACAWQREQILAMLPGGYSVDPQWLADEIRAQGER